MGQEAAKRREEAAACRAELGTMEGAVGEAKAKWEAARRALHSDLATLCTLLSPPSYGFAFDHTCARVHVAYRQSARGRARVCGRWRGCAVSLVWPVG